MIIKYPKLWIYSVIIFFIQFSRSVSVEVTIDDYSFAFYYVFGIIIWIIYTVFVKKEKIVKNYADFFILFFMLILPLNLIIALLHDVPFLNWLREYSLLLITLYFFPVRHYFKEEKDVKTLLFIFGGAVSIITSLQIYEYYKSLSDLTHAYQLAFGDKINQMIYTVTIIAGLMLYFFQNKMRNRIYIIFVVSFVSLGLILTFSRTFWLISLLGGILIFFYLPYQKKINMIKIITIISFISIGLIYSILGDKTVLYYDLLVNRFTSSTQGTKDVSVLSRLVEYKYVVSQIERFPFGGNGLAKNIFFLNPIDNQTAVSHNIHNGFLNLMYRMGIPLTLFYLSFLVLYLFKAYVIQKQYNYGFFKILSLIGMINIIGILIANITASVFFYRDGYFAIFLSVALIGIAEENLKKLKSKEKILENIL